MLDVRKLIQHAGRFLGVVVLIAAGLGGYFGLLMLKSEPAAAKPQKSITIVKTDLAAPYTEDLIIVTDGVAKPYREIVVSAEVGGRIQFYSECCRTGRFVKKGDLLVEIDPRNFEIEKSRLEKEISQAAVMVRELADELQGLDERFQLAQEDVILKQRAVERQRKLSGVVTETDLDRAKAEELTARNSLVSIRVQQRLLTTRRSRFESAEQRVQEQLKKASLDLERTKIAAPIDGVIVRQAVEQETYVQPGSELFTVEDTSKIEIRCDLKMDELYWLWRQRKTPTDTESRLDVAACYRAPQADADIVYNLAGHSFQWRGVLDRFEGSGLDERTRTIPARFVVDAPRNVEIVNEGNDPASIAPPALMRGMFVQVRMHVRPRASLIRLPELAIRPGGFVWLVDDGKLKKQVVKIARMQGSEAIIDALASNISVDDRVVVSPLAAPVEGMPVEEEGLR